MKKSELKQIIKEEIRKVLKENLSSEEKKALEDLFSFFIHDNYLAIDGNEIKTDNFEDIFSSGIESIEDDEEYLNFLSSIKNKLITHLIDNMGNKIKVSVSGVPQYYYSPFIKNNTIYINFIPLNYSEEKDTKFSNPKEIKIKWHPLEINGYKFYAYTNFNPDIKLGKGKNVIEFQSVKIPGNDITTYSLATTPHFETKKISEDTLQRRLILINYLKSNDIPFLIDTRDPSRSYVQVPITYTNLYPHK